MTFKLDFSPTIHGWHFANNFVNQIIGEWSTSGLCGGMAATAWDFFAAGLPIPSHYPEDFQTGPSGSQVPQTGTPLREYIYQRQMDTIDALNPVHLGRWLLLGDISQAERFHRDVRVDEFPKLRKQLEVEGSLGIVGLFSPVDGSLAGHQVLAYGFDDSPEAGGVGIWVYDSNFPDEEVLIAPSTSTDARQAFEVRVNGQVRGHCRGWFFMDWAYDRHNPVQPRYSDLVVSTSIGVEEQQPRVGGPLHLSYTVTNVGQAPARVDQLFVWIRKDNTNRDDLAGGGDGNAAPIPPGASRSIRTGTEAARGPAGAYRAGAGYLSRQVWRNIPAAANQRAQVDFGLAQDRPGGDGWRDLGGSLIGDVSAGVFADGRVAVFGLGRNGGVWQRVQTSPGADESWTQWAMLGNLTGLVGRPTVTRSIDGRLEIFVRSGDGSLWHSWQTTPNGSWSDWTRRGDGCTTEVAAGLNADGRMELFVCGVGGQVYHAYQRVVNGLWSGLEPLQLGKLFGNPAISANSDGRLEVAGRGLNGAIWRVNQTAPNGGWTDWSSLGGVLRSDPTIQRHTNGTLEIYASGLNNTAWHIWQQPGTPTGWSAWTPFDGVVLPPDARYAAEINPAGGVGIFIRGTAGHILERHVIDRDPWWSSWSSLGGTTIGSPTVVKRLNGRLSVFTRGVSSNLVHRYQDNTGNWIT